MYKSKAKYSEKMQTRYVCVMFQIVFQWIILITLNCMHTIFQLVMTVFVLMISCNGNVMEIVMVKKHVNIKLFNIVTKINESKHWQIFRVIVNANSIVQNVI